MVKWLAAGAIALLVLLFLLWRELGATEARPAAPPPSAPNLASATADAVQRSRPQASTTAAAGGSAAAPAAEVKPGKLDPRSDEFFYKFDEAVPKVLTRNAAICYEGRQGSLHRNQKVSLSFKVKVVNGEVSVTDVAVKESTIGDAALETCFIQQVQRSTWKDDELPDVAVDDEIVLRPERGMKKYWKSNVDYVGDEAPRL